MKRGCPAPEDSQQNMLLQSSTDAVSLSSSSPINNSNIGYQLLKKCGWKEGTGLGIAEQGRLDPIETYIKQDKRGVGAEKRQRKLVQKSSISSKVHTPVEAKESNKKTKKLSKRMRKLQEEEKRFREKQIEVEFSRLFWPDNV